ncbi:hypothetical protein ACHQM5_025580 [Ranunculus cassubicifolius]
MLTVDSSKGHLSRKNGFHRGERPKPQRTRSKEKKGFHRGERPKPQRTRSKRKKQSKIWVVKKTPLLHCEDGAMMTSVQETGVQPISLKDSESMEMGMSTAKDLHLKAPVGSTVEVSTQIVKPSDSGFDNVNSSPKICKGGPSKRRWLQNTCDIARRVSKSLSRCVQIWYSEEKPLKHDCIVERKVTKTRRGGVESFLIGRQGQVPSKAKWFSKEKGLLEFSTLSF